MVTTGLNRDYRRKIVAVDIDKTLCKGGAWTHTEVLEAKPLQEAIDKINEIYETGFVILYTGRRGGMASPTIDWLQRHGVKYHAIKFDKMPFDYYVDVDALRPDEL